MLRTMKWDENDIVSARGMPTPVTMFTHDLILFGDTAWILATLGESPLH